MFHLKKLKSKQDALSGILLHDTYVSSHAAIIKG